jgi:uncharacterized membrane protein YsdA (DUF1294 family)
VSAPRNPFRAYAVLFLVLSLGVAAGLHFGLGAGPLVAWLVGANLAAFPVWVWDKRRARTGGGRVPENLLHAMAALGATPASFLAMHLLRHKTQKRHFGILYAVLLIAQVAALVGWFGRAAG